MMWLAVVSKAARAVHGGQPVFVMIESHKVLKLAKNGGLDRWTSVSSTWEAFLEAACVEEVEDNLVTNMKMREPLPKATEAGSAWTYDFKRAVVEAIQHWEREPEALQVVKWMKKLDADREKFLEGFTDKELEMWRTHVRNNHVPYNRRCGTGVRSSATGRAHRRVRHPSAHCLSLDVAGPFRVKAKDPNHKDYRYLLVGAYVLPRQPSELRPESHEPPGEPSELRPESHEPPGEPSELRPESHEPPGEPSELRPESHEPPGEPSELRPESHEPPGEPSELRPESHEPPGEPSELRPESHEPPGEPSELRPESHEPPGEPSELRPESHEPPGEPSELRPESHEPPGEPSELRPESHEPPGEPFELRP